LVQPCIFFFIILCGVPVVFIVFWGSCSSLVLVLLLLLLLLLLGFGCVGKFLQDIRHGGHDNGQVLQQP
jgi:fatty acid desaturase